MGYRSDVAIALAFDSKDNLGEVMSVYALNENVQKHNLVEDWTVFEENSVHVVWYSAECVKWYEGYEEVDGIEHMVELAETFAEERDFKFASVKLRIGEEESDIVYDHSDISDTEDGRLSEVLWDHFKISRTLITP